MTPRTLRARLLPALILLAAACASGGTGIARYRAEGGELPRSMEVANFHIYAPGVAGGGQPAMEQMATLRERGYSAVVNLRTPGEMAGIPEAEAAAAAGLEYYEIPISGSSFSLVDAVRLEGILAGVPEGSVFLHCRSGYRAAALWGLYLGLTEGLAPEDAVEAARKAGMSSDVLAARVREELALAMRKR